MATRTFSIRLTNDQMVELREAAGGHGASLFAREAVLAAIAKRRPTRRQRQRDHLHRSLAEIQAALIDLVDSVGLHRPYSADPAAATHPNAAELASLRDEIRILAGAVLRLGRGLDDAGST